MKFKKKKKKKIKELHASKSNQSQKFLNSYKKIPPYNFDKENSVEKGKKKVYI